MANGVVELVREMRCHAGPYESNDGNRVDLERMHDRYVRRLVLPPGRKQIRVPVIAKGIVRIALNGAAVFVICGLPIAVEVQENIRQRGVGLGEIGIEFDRSLGCPARRWHDCRG